MRCERVAHHNTSVSSRISGFSLVELLIVMVLFIIVILISTTAFERILVTAGQTTKSSESNVQGVVGLEILQADLNHAGYGLPWVMTYSADFEESQVAANYLANGIDPAVFNDNRNTTLNNNKTPRAIQSGSATGAGVWENGRDYIVIKSTIVGMNAVSKKWTLVNYSGIYKQWGNDDFLLDGKERVTTLNPTTRKLQATASSDTLYVVPNTAPSVPASDTLHRPDYSNKYDQYLVYGVDYRSSACTGTYYDFPYNRVDYYIKRPVDENDISTRCAKGTGILYKANLNHCGGGVTQFPLLDCVADMQVSYNWMNTGWIDQNISAYTAEEIRTNLKEIRVDILTHEGQIDRNYTYPSSAIQVGPVSTGRVYDVSLLSGIGTEWKNYRWKIYTLILMPKNTK